MRGASGQIRPRLAQGNIALPSLLHSGRSEPRDILGGHPSILFEQGSCPVIAEPSKSELLDGPKCVQEPVS
eukprot:5141931-Alexandrium_andersonii.AAC.1